MRFEDKLEMIKNIAEMLDGGKLDLEDTLKYYEEGMKTIEECENILKDAKQKVICLEKK